MSNITTTPTGAALGAEVAGFDASTPLSEDEKAQVRQAFLDHKVIFIRGQQLTDPELLEFSSIFGEVMNDPRPGGLPPLAGYRLSGPD